MAHKRTQIRDAVTAILSGGGTAAGTRVFAHRTPMIFQSELPMIVVESREEAAQKLTLNSRQYKRTVITRVDIYDSGEGDNAMVSAVETIAAAVETLMEASSVTLDGLMIGLELTGLEIVNSTEGQTTLAGVRLNYAIHYQTNHSA